MIDDFVENQLENCFEFLVRYNWLCGNFESDDALDTFLGQAQAILVACNEIRRLSYQDIPKYIIYALQSHLIHKYFQKPRIPFLVFGKTTNAAKEKKSSANLQYKKIKQWRKQKIEKMRQVSNKFMPYLDVTDEQNTSMLLDLMLPLLKVMSEDETMQLEEMPTKFTRMRPDK